MPKITKKNIIVPLDVSSQARDEYIKNYLEITQNTGNLMLFAGDQKIEHQNGDFVGKNIAADDADPEHLFKIAKLGKIGVFAAQLGLIARYGMNYKTVPFLVKMNSRSNLVKTKQAEPYSGLLTTVDEVMEVKNQHKLKILALGYTLYLGSEYEALMLREAQYCVEQAHKNGLLAVLWIYPRGKAVKDELDPHIIAGAAGTACSLNADFVKVNYPQGKGLKSAEIFKEAIKAAGRTKVICSGGPSVDVKLFLQTLHDQIHISGAHGNATGRNIHQKNLKEAVKMCEAISAITLKNKTVEQALKLLKK